MTDKKRPRNRLPNQFGVLFLLCLILYLSFLFGYKVYCRSVLGGVFKIHDLCVKFNDFGFVESRQVDLERGGARGRSVAQFFSSDLSTYLTFTKWHDNSKRISINVEGFEFVGEVLVEGEKVFVSKGPDGTLFATWERYPIEFLMVKLLGAVSKEEIVFQIRKIKVGDCSLNKKS